MNCFYAGEKKNTRVLSKLQKKRRVRKKKKAQHAEMKHGPSSVVEMVLMQFSSCKGKKDQKKSLDGKST